MDNNQPESLKTHSRQFEAENTKNKLVEEAMQRAHTDPDRLVNALTAQQAKANEQLTVCSECLNWEIEQQRKLRRPWMNACILSGCCPTSRPGLSTSPRIRLIWRLKAP